MAKNVTEYSDAELYQMEKANQETGVNPFPDIGTPKLQAMAEVPPAPISPYDPAELAPIPMPQDIPNIAAATAQGLGQGATLGWGDEVGAAANATLDQMGFPGGGTMGNETWMQSFDRRLDSDRYRLDQARGDVTQEVTPTAVGSYAGELLGSLPLAILSGGAANPITTQVALGGLEGLGRGEGLGGSIGQSGFQAMLSGLTGITGKYAGWFFQKPTSQRVLAALEDSVESAKSARRNIPNPSLETVGALSKKITALEKKIVDTKVSAAVPDVNTSVPLKQLWDYGINNAESLGTGLGGGVGRFDPIVDLTDIYKDELAQ